MIELRKALDLVAPRLEAVARQGNIEVVVTRVERVVNGWVVCYNSAEFAETLDVTCGLVGNIPIEVGDDGQLRPSALR